MYILIYNNNVYFYKITQSQIFKILLLIIITYIIIIIIDIVSNFKNYWKKRKKKTKQKGFYIKVKGIKQDIKI